MAEIKMSELREKDQDSLVNLEKELTENLFAARLQKRTGQLENTAKIAVTKRDLARVKTVLRARELGLEVIETPTPGAKTEKKVAAKPSKSVKVEAKKKQAKESAKKPAKKTKAKKEEKKAEAKPAAKSKAAAKPAAKKAGKSAGKKK
jgi:large subunit ribosomal protein L29